MSFLLCEFDETQPSMFKSQQPLNITLTFRRNISITIFPTAHEYDIAREHILIFLLQQVLFNNNDFS